jgi:hypothetical protein
MLQGKVRSWAWPLLTFFGVAPGRYAVVLIAWAAAFGVLLLRGRTGAACAWLHGQGKGWRIAIGVLLFLAACDAALVIPFYLPHVRSWSEDTLVLTMQCFCMALGAGGAIVFISIGVLTIRHSPALPGIGTWLDALPRWQRVTAGLACLLLAAWVLYVAGEALWWLNGWQPKQPARLP